MTENLRRVEKQDEASKPMFETALKRAVTAAILAGVPHATSSDDIYDGYFIPKGATVICNAWGIARDEKRYPDPSRFMPERFMDVSGALTDDDPA
ncbi:cytochrome P450 [Suillus paluster]|uniref:cytochrome P450 n=1 Tax=Suillus paluster TaxID=48578 RepID=UPI001B883C57|nr:cytochrome P450 [Suillus paluster]KAG1733002.1 cytochrome P450 [Suillus paluster]